MKSFIVLFEEKEGTSPLVRLLDNFDQISVVHQINNTGWEPFDCHACGPMSLQSLEECLDLIFAEEPLDMERLNKIYTKTAKQPLENISRSGAVGFKMRFRPPIRVQRAIQRIALLNGFAAMLPGRFNYKHMMVDLIRRNSVVVFVAVRQDVLRWALSKYHGDGTGRPGHLQFRLASGAIRKDQIEKIHINCRRLGKLISECEKSHARKRALMNELQRAGIEVHVLRYEDFVGDKVKYFQGICEILEIPISTEEICAALSRGTRLEKVHSDKISDFVENHHEVMERFGHRFVAWQ